MTALWGFTVDLHMEVAFFKSQYLHAKSKTSGLKYSSSRNLCNTQFQHLEFL